MELNQLHYPFSKQARQINGFILKEKKEACIAGLGRDQLEHLASPMTKSETSRVQILTSPRQVRDDRKTSRVRTRVLQPYM